MAAVVSSFAGGTPSTEYLSNVQSY